MIAILVLTRFVILILKSRFRKNNETLSIYSLATFRSGKSVNNILKKCEAIWFAFYSRSHQSSSMLFRNFDIGIPKYLHSADKVLTEMLAFAVSILPT